MSALRRSSTLVLALALPVAAHAKTETRTALDLDASAGYSNNPFTAVGNDTAAGYAAFDVTPQFQWRDERTVITALASAHFDEYFNRYPTTDNYRGSLSYSGRPSSRVSVFTRVDLASGILGSYQNFGQGLASTGVIGTGTIGSGTTGTDTGGTVIGGSGVGTGIGAAPTTGFGNGTTFVSGPLIDDIGLFGTRARRRSLYATGGLSAALSERDSLNANAFGDLARYNAFSSTSNYDGYGGTLGYSHVVSAFTSIGLQGSFSRYAYNAVNNDTNVYSIEATGSTRLGQRWTIQGSLGASFVDSTSNGGSNRTSFSGNISACRLGPRSSLCATGSRLARATGFNGSQYVSTVGVDYALRLNERSNVGLNASYSDEGGLRTLNGQSRYLQISPSYSRQLLQRLHLVVSGRYRDVFGGGFNRPADYGGQAGVSYHLGRL